VKGRCKVNKLDFRGLRRGGYYRESVSTSFIFVSRYREGDIKISGGWVWVGR
jgi:hypothetical protein